MLWCSSPANLQDSRYSIRRAHHNAHIIAHLISFTASPTYKQHTSQKQVLTVLALQAASGDRIESIIHTGTHGYKGAEYDNHVLCCGHCSFTIHQPLPGQKQNVLIVKFELWYTKTKEGQGRSAALLEQSPGYFNRPLSLLSLSKVVPYRVVPPSTKFYAPQVLRGFQQNCSHGRMNGECTDNYDINWY